MMRLQLSTDAAGRASDAISEAKKGPRLLENGDLVSVSDSYGSLIQPSSFSHVYIQWPRFFYINNLSFLPPIFDRL